MHRLQTLRAKTGPARRRRSPAARSPNRLKPMHRLYSLHTGIAEL
jgi:hypothetical protein